MRERILKALNSSDLTQDEFEKAAHVVASLGAAQSRQEANPSPARRQEILAGLNIGSPRKQLSVGALLLHIRAGQSQFIPRVLGLVALQIVSKARRNAWKGVGRHNAHRIAQVALDRFLDANCGSCNGVGTIGELGQLIVICQTCKGSGDRKDDLHDLAKHLGMTIRAFRDLDMIERIRDVVSLMDRMEGYAASGTRRQAKGDDD